MSHIIRVIKVFHTICCNEILIIVLIQIRFIINTSLIFGLSNRSILSYRIFFWGKSYLISFFKYTSRVNSICTSIIIFAFLILKNINCRGKVLIILSRWFLYRRARWIKIILDTLTEVFLIYLFWAYNCSYRNPLNCLDYRQTFFIYCYFRIGLI